MESSQLNIEIFEDVDSICERAATFIVDLAGKSIEARGQFALSLSGGHTPEKLYTLLSSQQFAHKIDWHKTFIFWGDERCVPAGDDKNNAHMAKTLLLNKIDIPVANIFTIPVNLPPAESAIQYEQEIKKFFGTRPPHFDLILLGLGENGHTASLFPGTAIVQEQSFLVKEVYIPEQKMFRISMTASLINFARNILFLVAGKEKAQILNTVLNTAYQPDKYPAQMIRPSTGNLYWFADKSAVALL